ncbi:MAG TPA: hypothetical protein P5545_01665 [Bacteroidota bacterium]|nr:hypothetical protein [Candidatus Kapabacteria bacterium]HRS01238.1 hypothetical protein [Bacteroidota bacterium]HRT67701.1 hypothetical protein [Bacteroidota bacterium]
MKYCKILYALFFIISLLNINIAIAGSAGRNYSLETMNIVNMPTAGSIPLKSQFFELYFSQNSCLNIKLLDAPFRNFYFGLSEGATNFFGNGNITFQKYPGLIANYRILNEGKYYPAIGIGINTQGKGNYNESKDEFDFISPGVYLAVSKSFLWSLGYFGLHIGTNYSFEPASSNRRFNLYFGIEQSLTDKTSINLEYDVNTPENPDFVFNKALLNLALRYSIDNNITIDLNFLDLFKTKNAVMRYLKIEGTINIF